MRTPFARLAQLFDFGWMITHRLRGDLRGAMQYIRGRLLDVGCGDKTYSSIVKTHVDRHYGVDLPSTHASGQQVDAWADGLYLPFATGTFDTVLCTQVLEHVTDPAMLLAEMARVLCPDGHLLLSAPLFSALHEEPHDYYRFTRHGLALLLARAGLQVLEIHPQGGFWFNRGQTLAFYLLDHSNHRPLRRALARLLWAGLAPLYLLLDHLFPDERYTMNYFVVAARTEGP